MTQISAYIMTKQSLFEIITVLCLLLCAQSVASQESELTSDLRKKVEASLKIQRNWGEKLNTPGVTLRLKESRREHRGGQVVVAYRLYAAGLPANLIYTMLTAPVNATVPQKSLDGVTLAPDGLAICAGRTAGQCGNSDRPDDPIDLVFMPVKGEPHRVALVSEDGQYKAFASVVSDPIQGKDNGCEISVVRLCPSSN